MSGICYNLIHVWPRVKAKMGDLVGKNSFLLGSDEEELQTSLTYKCKNWQTQRKEG